MSAVPQFILTAPPETSAQAASFGVPVAHMAYRIGENGHLYRAGLSVAVRGGLMVLDDAGLAVRGDPLRLCREVLLECGARKFDGILCDFSAPPSPFLEQTVTRLSMLTARNGWSLYVNEAYASLGDRSLVLIPSSVVHGSLETRLGTAVQAYGAHRVALAVQRCALEYALPSGADCGRRLAPGELSRLVRQFSPAIFFDHNLCAHYFTYMEQGTAHFVLFDDSGSLLRKVSLARELGIRRVFFTYPEVADILPRLLAQ